MGVFKNIKKRYIAIISVCVVIVVSCGVYIGITFWPKKEKTPEPTKSEQSNEQQEQSDGPLYEVVSCEELSKITGEACNNNTETPNYQTYTPNYTAPDSTNTQTPTQYNTPNINPTPSNAPTCADYHAQYYAEFNTKLHETNSRYTNAINNAASSCGSFGGCPQKAELERQWQNEVTMLKNSYKTSMTNAGCDPNQYVDF